jgi:hypothetical protein
MGCCCEGYFSSHNIFSNFVNCQELPLSGLAGVLEWGEIIKQTIMLEQS